MDIDNYKLKQVIRKLINTFKVNEYLVKIK